MAFYRFLHCRNQKLGCMSGPRVVSGVVWPARLGRDCSETSFPGLSNSMQLFKKDKLCINTVVHEGTYVKFRVRRSSNVGAGYIEVTPTSVILPAVSISCPAREGGVWGRDWPACCSHVYAVMHPPGGPIEHQPRNETMSVASPTTHADTVQEIAVGIASCNVYGTYPISGFCGTRIQIARSLKTTRELHNVVFIVS